MPIEAPSPGCRSAPAPAIAADSDRVCKSGRLDARRGDFDDLVQRTEAVRTVLSSMGQSETHFLFFVVYDPVTNPEEEMKERLEPSSIRPLKPTEVRSVVAGVLQASLG